MDNVPTLLIESNSLFREGLKRVLSGSPYTIQKEADSLEDAVKHLNRDFSPELLIINVHDRDIHRVVEGIRSLRCRLINARIVVLSFDTSIEQQIAALEAGADACLVYDMPPEALVQSLTLIMIGVKIFPKKLAQLLIDGLSDSNKHKCPNNLSGREIQILRCLAGGEPNKVIARNLGLSETSLKANIQRLLRKINASNRTQAAIWAIEQGICTKPDNSAWTGAKGAFSRHSNQV